ncbi:alcohol dehydrogenase catalytic domain-containing protein [Curtobacterium sp. MCPF17_052]|uniref:alcohol dehydrogenase catalytic domain-containing protein n=1 Tax=Curtobacterium sp. MCPF17_052 TaxID=2175655 RepID=UPI003463D052
MRATVVSEYGDPEVLVVRDVPLPVPGPGQVRISVRAAGISPTDLHIRAGDLSAFFALPEPAILGFEAAGVVDALGDGVTGVSVGDEVAARLPRLGGYADFVLADAWTPKPESVSWEEAGSLPTAAEAAVAALRQLGVAKGGSAPGARCDRIRRLDGRAAGAVHGGLPSSGQLLNETVQWSRTSGRCSFRPGLRSVTP